MVDCFIDTVFLSILKACLFGMVLFFFFYLHPNLIREIFYKIFKMQDSSRNQEFLCFTKLYLIWFRHRKTQMERGSGVKSSPVPTRREKRKSPNVSMDASFAFSKDSVADDFGEEMMAWIDKESTNQNPSFVWPMKFVVIYKTIEINF